MDQIIFAVKENSAEYLENCLPAEIKDICGFITDVVSPSGLATFEVEKCLVICDDRRVYELLHECGIRAAYWEHPAFTDADDMESGPEEVCPGAEYVITEICELQLQDYVHIYNRLHGLPCEILQTERLIVRETTVQDVDELLLLYKDPEITLYMEDLFEPDKEREYQRNYIKNIYGFYDIGIWSLVLKASEGREGKLIGRMGIEMTEDEGTAELGFMLGKEYQGCGYAAEAGRAVLGYAETVPGVRKVRARVHRDNRSSIILCERLGMKYAGGGFEKDDEMLLYICEFDNNNGISERK